MICLFYLLKAIKICYYKIFQSSHLIFSTGLFTTNEINPKLSMKTILTSLIEHPSTSLQWIYQVMSTHLLTEPQVSYNELNTFVCEILSACCKHQSYSWQGLFSVKSCSLKKRISKHFNENKIQIYSYIRHLLISKYFSENKIQFYINNTGHLLHWSKYFNENTETKINW